MEIIDIINDLFPNQHAISQEHAMRKIHAKIDPIKLFKEEDELIEDCENKKPLNKIRSKSNHFIAEQLTEIIFYDEEKKFQKSVKLTFDAFEQKHEKKLDLLKNDLKKLKKKYGLLDNENKKEKEEQQKEINNNKDEMMIFSSSSDEDLLNFE